MESTIALKLKALNYSVEMASMINLFMIDLSDEVITLEEFIQVINLLNEKGIIITKPSEQKIIDNGFLFVKKQIDEMETLGELDAYIEKPLRINSKGAALRIKYLKSIDEPFKTPDGKYSSIPFSKRKFEAKYGVVDLEKFKDESSSLENEPMTIELAPIEPSLISESPSAQSGTEDNNQVELSLMDDTSASLSSADMVVSFPEVSYLVDLTDEGKTPTDLFKEENELSIENNPILDSEPVEEIISFPDSVVTVQEPITEPVAEEIIEDKAADEFKESIEAALNSDIVENIEPKIEPETVPATELETEPVVKEDKQEPDFALSNDSVENFEQVTEPETVPTTEIETEPITEPVVEETNQVENKTFADDFKKEIEAEVEMALSDSTHEATADESAQIEPETAESIKDEPQEDNEKPKVLAEDVDPLEEILSKPQTIGLNDDMFDRYEKLSDSISHILVSVYGVDEVNDSITDNLIKLVTNEIEDDRVVLYLSITYGKNVSEQEQQRLKSAIEEELEYTNIMDIDLGRAA